MTYVLSIDWLAIHCHYMPPAPSADEDRDDDRPLMDAGAWLPVETDGTMFGAYDWRYMVADYGTRQFRRLTFVSIPNAEGGRDDFAEVQSEPHSGILNRNSVIIRFVNRALYAQDFWTLANRFLSDNNLVFKGISRIDICADFNDFKDLAPLALIEGFAAKKYRHVGRGVGALYFNHGVASKEYSVRYTGLSFGTHGSDSRVYLYNKSFELLTQGDKPWIRDQWVAAGLDVRHVWRLEISIKSAGCKFKDKSTGKEITIDTDKAEDGSELAKIYHTFVRKLFAFVVNRKGITNITREPRLQLFEGAPVYDRGCIRNVSAGTRFDKMFIKALYQLGDLYRGESNVNSADLAQSFAIDIAESCDLQRWMSEKINEWERPTHK